MSYPTSPCLKSMALVPISEVVIARIVTGLKDPSSSGQTVYLLLLSGSFFLSSLLFFQCLSILSFENGAFPLASSLFVLLFF